MSAAEAELREQLAGLLDECAGLEAAVREDPCNEELRAMQRDAHALLLEVDARLRAAAPARFEPSAGERVEAQWPETGVWYAAEVRQAGGDGVRVRFAESGAVRTLARKHVRAAPAGAAAAAAGKRGRFEVAVDADGRAVIPAALQARDGDPEDERTRKAKQAKKLCDRARAARNEFERDARRAEWRQFAAGAAKRRRG